MIRKIKNWNKLIKYIRLYRKIEGGSTFTILTTGDELIIYPDKLERYRSKTLRLRQDNL